jgi:NitT/TauT family transport system substrate-binding protein
MKKRFTILFIILGMILLTSCGKAGDAENSAPESNQPSQDTPSGQEFNIGILPAESAIPIILAKEKGYFDETEVKVNIKAFASPNDRNVAVQARELDAAIGDVMTVASFVDRGIPMKITSDISEDFKILSSPASGITTMEGLSGKRISLVPNFILEYIMDQFAKENGFTYEIVEIPSFSGRTEALMSNQIDGVVYTEPQAGMLVNQGAHLLGSSKEAGIKGGTLLFTEDMIASRPGDIRAFYQAYNKAVDYMNETDVKEYSDILTQYQFPEAISDYLSGMNGDFLYAGVISEDQFDNIIQWTKEKGQISKVYSYQDLTDFSFIK